MAAEGGATRRLGCVSGRGSGRRSWRSRPCPIRRQTSQAREFAAAFRGFLDWVHAPAAGEDNEVSALVRDFLGLMARSIPW